MTLIQYILIGVITITFIVYSTYIIKDFSTIFYINKNKYTENRHLSKELDKRMVFFLTKYEKHPHVQRAIDQNELAHIVNNTFKEAKEVYFQHGKNRIVQVSFDLFLTILLRASVIAWIITFNYQILMLWATIFMLKIYIKRTSGTPLRKACDTLWFNIADKLNLVEDILKEDK